MKQVTIGLAEEFLFDHYFASVDRREHENTFICYSFYSNHFFAIRNFSRDMLDDGSIWDRIFSDMLYFHEKP